MSTEYCREHLQTDTAESPCPECSAIVEADDRRLREARAEGAAAERAAILRWIKRFDSTHEKVVEALYTLREGIEQGAHARETE